MKTIILCGGEGTRMKEETEFKPKPLVSVGGMPIVRHIMKIYAHYGYRDFILALGYRGHLIKSFFLNECQLTNNFTLDTKTGEMIYHDKINDDGFRITFVETGLKADTGRRILEAGKHIDGDGFMVTFGDGVADIDIGALIKFHRQQGTLGSVTGVHPYSKYGLMAIDTEKNLVRSFDQKPLMYDYVNGGFMVFQPEALVYFDDGPMEDGLKRLIADGQLSVYRHEGFWKAMDTYREMEELNKIWRENKPWAVWE